MAKKEKQPTKEDNLKATIEHINKAYGKGTVMKLGDSPIQNISVIPTGSIKLDKALGIGGYPRGRIVEIFGGESIGKSSFTLHAISNSQKSGDNVALIDIEHAFDVEYAKKLGVDTDNLFLSQPDNGEAALEVADHLIRSGSVGIVVIDSVAALTPKAELEGEMGDSVTYDTPVYIRNKNNKNVKIIPIKDLYKGGKLFDGKRYSNKYKKTKGLEILTHSGWSDLKAVFFKENRFNKSIYITSTINGFVKTTPDHSLYSNKREISPTELKKSDILDTTDSPKNNQSFGFINYDVGFLIGAWCGDGHIYCSEGVVKNNRFQYTTTDKSLCDKIFDILSYKIGISVYVKEKTFDGNRQKQYFIDTESSSLVKYLLDESYSSISKLKIVPEFVLNGADDVINGFLEGFYESDGNHHSKHYYRAYYNNSLPLLAGVQYLYELSGHKTRINFSKNRANQLSLIIDPAISELREQGTIKRIFESNIHENYIYDIETESGTFVTALGNVVLHNSKMGLHARLMSQAMRKMAANINNTNTCCIFVNQTRTNIGQMWGSPIVTTGGNALKFYSSVRLDLKRLGQVKHGEEVIGHTVRVNVVKNKLAPPFKKVDFDIIYGEGISRSSEILNLAVEQGIVKQSGSWFYYGDTKLGQGAENVRQLLKDNPDLMDEIEKKVRENLK